MKKEEWINNILNSASEIKEAEVNPFLYEKTLQKLSFKKAKRQAGMFYKAAMATAVILFIILNVSSILIYRWKMDKQSEYSAVKGLSEEMMPNTTFNY